MAKWVECKGAAGGSVFVNLDNVLTILGVSGGSEITFLGRDEPMLVASTPIEMLLYEDVQHG